MAYRTKFRKVNLPISKEDSDALGYDANSVRSVGAAVYREISKHYHRSELPKRLKRVFEGSREVLEKSIGVPSHKELTYMSQGAMRAAKEAGDKNSVEYLSSLLEKL